jgi:DNA-binding LacI/PurR family transcriptional regulator
MEVSTCVEQLCCAVEVGVTVLALSDPRPTLADVARTAGVSTATASRVINGFAKVKPETRQQVEDAISVLGYVRQRVPRMNNRRHTRSVAVVVCEDALRLVTSSLHGRALWGASRVLALAGMQTVLLTAQPEGTPFAEVGRLRAGNVDGALFVSMDPWRPVVLGHVSVPVVGIGRLAGDRARNYSHVEVDNRGGAERATRYLIGRGRTRIATVAGPRELASGVDRLSGYCDVMTGCGRFDPSLVVHGDFGLLSGEHAAARLLERRPDLDAIFVASDLMAVGVLRALRRRGRKVPDDVAVVGFDNAPVARSTEPPLTTVSQPAEAMGARAARELLALIAGDAVQPRRTVLAAEMILRESA